MEMDEISQEWLDALCAQALVDGKLSSALMVIGELASAINEGRQVNENYLPILNQMLAAYAAVRVQQIGWMSE